MTLAMTEPLRYVRHARSPRNVALLLAVWTGLATVMVLFQAAWWLIALCALPTLPLLSEIITDRRAGLDLDAARLSWFSGRLDGSVALDEIAQVRLDTRWDFSIRATLCLHSGKEIRLPQESLPPHREFEEILTARGLAVVRHHFAGR